jgi:hypothetical protein
MPVQERPTKQQRSGHNPSSGPAPYMEMTTVRGVNALAKHRARKEAEFLKVQARQFSDRGSNSIVD